MAAEAAEAMLVLEGLLIAKNKVEAAVSGGFPRCGSVRKYRRQPRETLVCRLLFGSKRKKSKRTFDEVDRRGRMCLFPLFLPRLGARACLFFSSNPPSISSLHEVDSFLLFCSVSSSYERWTR